MLTTEAIEAGKALLQSCRICCLGTNHEDGYPRQKAMLYPLYTGIEKVWLTTNTDSKRIAQLRQDPRASIYFVDEARFKGLLLVGDITLRNDREAREMMWKPGYEVYYPLGIDDPDYTVLEFTTRSGNFYHGLANVDFTI